MLLVCPTCATSYMIDPASLGPTGRTVRCARCKTSWFAGGPNAEMAGFVADVIAEAEAREAPPAPAKRTAPVPADDFGAETTGYQADVPASEAEPPLEQQAISPGDAPPLVPPMADGGMPDADGDIEAFAARRARAQERRKSKRRSSKWTAIILLLLGFNVALFGARDEVVRFLPQTASLFAAVGLPVNLRQMTFENVKIIKEEHDGVAVLTVEGTIRSLADKPLEVPRLRFAVRNATGQEIYAWSATASHSIIEPGAKLPFRSRLASPPSEASDVLVRFINAHDVEAGYNKS